ncbi:hypothetical protein GF324_13555 [bacterium]|nr:hypothetical protein [bacterium]
MRLFKLFLCKGVLPVVSIPGTSQDWTRHDVNVEFDDAQAVYPADIDGDGDTAMVGGDGVSSETPLVWWSNDDGGSSWTRQTVDEGFVKPDRDPAGECRFAGVSLQCAGL